MGTEAEPETTMRERVVRHEQTQALYARGPVALVANLVNSAILVAALWPEVSHRTALGWLFVMYATVGLRLVLVARHHRAAAGTYDARRWMRRWTASTAVTGALWGAAGVLLYPADSLSGQYLLLFLIGGMVAGASSSMSSCLPAFLAFALPTLVPPIVRLTLENDRHRWAMAALLVIFGVGMTALVRTGARTLREAIWLRLRNTKLANDLTQVHEQLVDLKAKLEHRVAERTEDLEHAMRERDSLVAIVSHELRSPLSSMTLSQEVLEKRVERQTLDLPELRRNLGVLSRQLNRMRRLVDDLFDVTRLSTDQMSYDKQAVELSSIVDDTIEELSSQRQFVEAKFAISVERGLRGSFDRLRIQQVLVNLISNALKHGAPPFGLEARRIGERAQIVVHDHGPGVPAEQARRIFDAFQRGPSAAAPGLGLGLYLSQRIVDAHGGTIRVESSPGEGTSFIVELPLLGAIKMARPSGVPADTTPRPSATMHG
jgi:signal transduction histidine kinase